MKLLFLLGMLFATAASFVNPFCLYDSDCDPGRHCLLFYCTENDGIPLEDRPSMPIDDGKPRRLKRTPVGAPCQKNSDCSDPQHCYRHHCRLWPPTLKIKN